jgi:Zn-finger nucleic acid-binding protein
MIETCDSCNGEWLDGDEIKKITDLREQHFDAETRRAIAESHSYDGTSGLHVHDKNLVCPKCGITTDPINYGGGSGIIIERCCSCKGFWLDDQELEKVQMLVEGWEDALPDDLRQYRGTLTNVAGTTETRIEADEREAGPSKTPIVGPFINACINGIIDIF